MSYVSIFRLGAEVYPTSESDQVRNANLRRTYPSRALTQKNVGGDKVTSHISTCLGKIFNAVLYFVVVWIYAFGELTMRFDRTLWMSGSIGSFWAAKAAAETERIFLERAQHTHIHTRLTYKNNFPSTSI